MKKILSVLLVISFTLFNVKIVNASETWPGFVTNVIANMNAGNAPTTAPTYFLKTLNPKIRVYTLYYFGPSGSATQNFAAANPSVYQSSELATRMQNASKYKGVGYQSIYFLQSFTKSIMSYAPKDANGKMDYAAIMNQNHPELIGGGSICQRIANDSYPSQVWVFTTPDANGHEFTTNGVINSSGVGDETPPCGNQYVVFGFVPMLDMQGGLRHISQAMHSYGHFMERMLTISSFHPRFTTSDLGCVFVKKSHVTNNSFFWPNAIPTVNQSLWTANNCAYTSDLGITGLAKPVGQYWTTASCGSIHRPPNVQYWEQEYLYNSAMFQDTYCNDFQTNWWNQATSQGVVTSSWIDCTAWGCNEDGYMTWWFQHLPGRGVVSKNIFTGAPDKIYNVWDILWLKN